MMKAIRNAAVDNRLSCEKARALAKELNVPVREIGAHCNELKIRIAACELGCF
jgi:hypothetical protein